MKISYAITVKDEVKEFTKLVDSLLQWKDSQDEIVVLVDGSNTEIVSYLKSKPEIHTSFEMFSGRFDEHKNRLNSYCSGDWIFQIDADELPTEKFIKNLHTVLENTSAELIYVPRCNIVNGITEKDIKEWHWKVENGLINWPDYQGRLYLNIPRIRWEGKVHEKITGYLKYTYFPSNISTEWRLDHVKDIDRQRKQNKLYQSM